MPWEKRATPLMIVSSIPTLFTGLVVVTIYIQANHDLRNCHHSMWSHPKDIKVHTLGDQNQSLISIPPLAEPIVYIKILRNTFFLSSKSWSTMVRFKVLLLSKSSYRLFIRLVVQANLYLRNRHLRNESLKKSIYESPEFHLLWSIFNTLIFIENLTIFINFWTRF